jgi:hypothetical protein
VYGEAGVREPTSPRKRSGLATRNVPFGLPDVDVTLGVLTLLAIIAKVGTGAFVPFEYDALEGVLRLNALTAKKRRAVSMQRRRDKLQLDCKFLRWCH